MKKQEKILLFGFGQTAKYLIKELRGSKKKYIFFATSTKKTGIHYFNKKNKIFLNLIKRNLIKRL